MAEEIVIDEFHLTVSAPAGLPRARVRGDPPRARRGAVPGPAGSCRPGVVPPLPGVAEGPHRPVPLNHP